MYGPLLSSVYLHGDERHGFVPVGPLPADISVTRAHTQMLALLSCWPRYRAKPSPVPGLASVHCSAQEDGGRPREVSTCDSLLCVARDDNFCQSLDRNFFRSVKALMVQNFSTDLVVQVMTSSNPAGVRLATANARRCR